jgi:hypothetical protein
MSSRSGNRAGPLEIKRYCRSDGRKPKDVLPGGRVSGEITFRQHWFYSLFRGRLVGGPLSFDFQPQVRRPVVWASRPGSGPGRALPQQQL